MKETELFNMYNHDNSYESIDFQNMNNRLLCTFSSHEDLDALLNNLTRKYDIMYKKIFVLEIKGSNEYACTYNIEQGNSNTIPNNTILVHRKKQHNVLYSLNALNEIIRSCNQGVIDTNFPVSWGNYKNSIMLTQDSQLKQLNTKLYRIVEA